MNKICTSLEQSKKLIELGIDVNTADIYWSKCTIIDFGDGTLKVSYTIEPCNISQFKNTDEDVPAWSLSALLEIIPNVEIKSKIQNFNNKSWLISSHDDEGHNHIWVYNDELIDACVELIIKLKKIEL